MAVRSQGVTKGLAAEPEPTPEKYDPKRSGHKYHKLLVSFEGATVTTDVYRVLSAFQVTEPGIQHAIKKLLLAGSRNFKTTYEDLQEAIVAIEATLKAMDDAVVNE